MLREIALSITFWSTVLSWRAPERGEYEETGNGEEGAEVRLAKSRGNGMHDHRAKCSCDGRLFSC